MQLEAGYSKLKEHFQEARLLESALELLGWDERTYIPPLGYTHRGNQNALLAKLHHERISAPWVGDLLGELTPEALKLPEDHEIHVNTREWLKVYTRAKKVPVGLVEELNKTLVQSQQVWQDARRENKFGTFAPLLQRVFELKKQEALYVRPGGDVYEVLLDDYEPGFSSKKLDALISGLKPKLIELMGKIQSKQCEKPPIQLQGPFAIEKQKVLSELVASFIGFDFEKGRLDTTAHPFCTGIGPGDCRITTKFDESDFTSGLLGVMHEAGHGIYEQGMDSLKYGLPTGSFCSLGIHESQSRLFENLIGRSRKFWQWALPVAKRIFSPTLGSVSLEDFVYSINIVRPNLIRIESDELTYNFHIMLRYELEKAMLTGDLKVSDLPQAWNEKIKNYLGLDVPNDSKGCLQDIHWSAGLIGYFPTYMLGNLFSAQIMRHAKSKFGWHDSDIETFLTKLNPWLRKNIHTAGKTYSSMQLVEKITGEKLNSDAFLAHLEGKLEFESS